MFTHQWRPKNYHLLAPRSEGHSDQDRQRKPWGTLFWCCQHLGWGGSRRSEVRCPEECSWRAGCSSESTFWPNRRLAVSDRRILPSRFRVDIVVEYAVTSRQWGQLKVSLLRNVKSMLYRNLPENIFFFFTNIIHSFHANKSTIHKKYLLVKITIKNTLKVVQKYDLQKMWTTDFYPQGWVHL